MALWLFRAGRQGEYEKRFLDDKRVYVTWEGLRHDLSKLKSKKELLEILVETYPDSKLISLQVHVGQIWPAVREMKPDD